VKRNARPRETNDFYRTPYDCTRALLAVETFGPVVWEPACGDGAISRVLAADGYGVVSTDLFDRGYGTPGVDFTLCMDPLAPDIVTNPPYRLAERFIVRAHDLGAVKVAFLLRLAFLAGENRRKRLWSQVPPSKVWVCSARPTLWDGSDLNPQDHGGATDYAWFVWQRGRAPEPPGWLGRPATAGLSDAYRRAEDAHTMLGRALNA